MKISAINNTNYKRPAFGAIKIDSPMPDSVLKEVVDNPTFIKLAERLQEKGEDLYISYVHFPLVDNDRLVLVKGKEMEFINSSDVKSNSLEEAIKRYTVLGKETLMNKLDGINKKILSSVSKKDKDVYVN